VPTFLSRLNGQGDAIDLPIVGQLDYESGGVRYFHPPPPAFDPTPRANARVLLDSWRRALQRGQAFSLNGLPAPLPDQPADVPGVPTSINVVGVFVGLAPQAVVNNQIGLEIA
jgi:hypothetical protein